MRRRPRAYGPMNRKSKARKNRKGCVYTALFVLLLIALMIAAGYRCGPG